VGTAAEFRIIDRCTDAGCASRRNSGSRPHLTLLAIAILATGQPAAGKAAEIATWATNAPEWNARLGVTHMRQGCSLDPADCLRNIRVSAKSQQINHWMLAVKCDVSRWPDTALEYSRRSLTEPLLVEVGIDDFVSTLKSWHLSTLGRANTVLDQVTQNVKQQNPRLRFGITLYVDELDSLLLTSVPVETRKRVDRVALYLHFRADGGNYAAYVVKARRLFPRAAIWAGSYAYDRIDYLPCAQSDSRPCTQQEEMSLFRTSLRDQLKLMQSGELTGIEFYPGLFGREDQWHGWRTERICRPARTKDCIENTRRMRLFVAQELSILLSSEAKSSSAGSD
jgi:hypothetical protein